MFGKSQQPAGPKKCAHAACYCMVDAGKKYCSDHCQDCHGMTELNCHCQHAACKPA